MELLFGYVGLGAVLVGIGIVYQKLIFARPPRASGAGDVQP
jgi:uncharacterized membrane protein